MSTGTNQKKRGAKEAYVKVKVEVATLEVEVEELKDVLQVLKASKADKEALEGGDSVWEVINFISNFEIKMRSHKVSKGDQKIYLLEALKLGVVRVLDMRGVDNSLMDELFEEVRRKVLGYNYLNLILDDWQRVFQKEEERVVDFKVQVCTYLCALGIDML